MAVYRLSASIIGRSSGRSATAAAAYRAGVELTDERTGQRHDYSRRSGVIHSEVLAPDQTPEWMTDRAQLWNAVERAEKRKDAQLAREILLSLPHELTDGERRQLVRDFVQGQFVARGMIADLAIHLPGSEGDNRNHHAHVMLTMRELAGDGFADKKNRGWNGKDVLEGWRQCWAEHQNARFAQLGYDLKVDHRSVIDRGEDHTPEPKLGPRNSKLHRVGLSNDQIEAWRQARADRQELIRVNREIARFETWATARKADLERKKGDGLREMERKQEANTAEVRDMLDNFHAPEREKAESALKAIRERQERASGPSLTQPVRKWWYGVSGQRRRDEQQEDVSRSNLSAIKNQTSKVTDQLAKEQAAEREKLEKTYDWRALKQDSAIERTRQGREASGWTWPSPSDSGRKSEASKWWHSATQQPDPVKKPDLQQERDPSPKHKGPEYD